MSEIADIELRWPQDGDRLFVASHWAYDTHVVSDRAERFYRIPTGHRRAGDILVDQASANTVDRPNVTYTALFCYRQSIELFFKKRIDEFGQGRVFSPREVMSGLVDFFECAYVEFSHQDEAVADVRRRAGERG